MAFLLIGLLFLAKNNDKAYSVYEYEAPDGMRPSDLMQCFEETYSIDPKIDSLAFPKKPYLPEDLGEFFLHKQIKVSGYTASKEKADYFVVNTMPILSEYVGDCNGMNHQDRQNEWVKIIKDSNEFQERPQDHLFICQSFTCQNTVNGEMYDLAKRMTYLIHELNAKWVTDIPPEKPDLPEHAIVVPYVVHSKIFPFNHKSWVEREYKVSFIGTIKGRKGNLRYVLLDPTVIDKPYLHVVMEGVKVINRVSAVFDNYVNDMTNSQFCLVIEGDSPSSRRLFDAMVAGCIPVFIGSNYSKPFENIIPYDDFSIRISKDEWLYDAREHLERINEISDEEALEMQSKMLKYVKYIDWRNGDDVFEGILSNMDLIREDSDQHVQWQI